MSCSEREHCNVAQVIVVEHAMADILKRYVIGNASGHQNGWCHIEHIYGRLVKVDT